MPSGNWPSARPDCVLLDMNLPDANGIDALDRITDATRHCPIVVLTGLTDEHFGISALGAGAQDYLVKGRVEAEMLRRAVLTPSSANAPSSTAVELHASQLRARENARLERGLLPSPLLLDDPGVDIVARYRPSRENALLGGDFYDFVQTADRTVHVMIGDVAGHGPDEAALGVALRIAWRALTFAGLRGPAPDARSWTGSCAPSAQAAASSRRCMSLAIPPTGLMITAVRAGHPGMLLHHERNSGVGGAAGRTGAGPAHR